MKHHELLSIAFQLEMYENNTDVLLIGDELTKSGADSLTDAGFWIWNINSNVEYYSPNFRGVLGFEGEEDFPSVSQSWQNNITNDGLKTAISNFKKPIELFSWNS